MMANEMSCDRAAELMPWYLNQTLEPDEHAGMEAHLAGCEACRRERDATRQAAVLLTGHLPVDVILDLVDDSLRPGLSPERIEAHLAECDTCREEVELARASARDLEAAVDAEQEMADRAGQPAQRPGGSARSWWLAAAASMLIAVASGGWWTTLQELGTTRDRLAAIEGTAPTGPAGEGSGANGLIEVPVVDLFPGGLLLRGGDDAVTVVPAGTPAATLILNTELADPAAGAASRVAGREVTLVLRDASGATVLELGGLSLRPLHSPTVSLPVSRLAPGSYELLITAADQSEPLESYPLRIE